MRLLSEILYPDLTRTGTFAFGNDGGMGLVHSKFNGLLEVTNIDFDYISCFVFFAAGIKDGELYTWGLASAEQELGQGITNTYNGTPTKIGTGTDWSSVSAGLGHGAAIKSDGTLWTWGAGGNGQLGQGGAPLSSPTQVGTDTNWTKVSGGLAWTAAIKGGQLLTCGANSSFRTGLNTSSGNTLSFTVANTDTDWTDISAGNTHGLGIKNGELWSWGENLYGATGRGTTTGSTQVPTQVGSASDWVQISAGRRFSAAINSSGELFTWGIRARGVLGDGNTTGTTTVPTLVGSATDWLSVAATPGDYFWSNLYEGLNIYALKTDGTLWATGLNGIGQAGQPNSTNVTTFTQVGAATNHTLIAAGLGNCITVRRNLP